MSPHRLLPLATALFLLHQPVHAAKTPEDHTETQTELAAPNDNETGRNRKPSAEMVEHRRQVGQRAMQILGALTAEIRAQQGQPADAYGYYMALYQRNRDAAIIERAAELALESGHIAAARVALARWQQNQADASESPNFKRLQWQVASLSGDIASVSAGLPEALSEPQKHKLRANFRQLAQLIANHPKIASPANTERVIQTAAANPDMVEANVAAALFAAFQNRETDSHAALLRLQNTEHLDPNDLRLTLKLLQERHPEQLQHFFQNHPVERQHSSAWQTAYVLHLIQQNQIQVAYDHINRFNSTNPLLRLQAARLAEQLHQDHAAAQSHYEAAHRYSATEDKNTLVQMVVEHFIAQKQNTAAKNWANRLTDADQQFNRHIFLARIALLERQFDTVRQHLQQAQRQRNREALPIFLVQIELDKIQNPQNAIRKLEQILAQPNAHLPRNLSAAQKNTLLDLLREQHTLLLSEQPSRLNEAIATLRQRLQQEPNNPSVLNALGYTLLSLPNPDLNESRRYIEQAHRLQPDSSAIRDSLGWVLFKQGHAEEALPHLQAAYAEQPDGEVAAHLIETLHQLGRHDDVRALLQKLPASERHHRVLQNTLQRLNITQP